MSDGPEEVDNKLLLRRGLYIHPQVKLSDSARPISARPVSSAKPGTVLQVRKPPATPCSIGTTVKPPTGLHATLTEEQGFSGASASIAKSRRPASASAARYTTRLYDTCQQANQHDQAESKHIAKHAPSVESDEVFDAEAAAVQHRIRRWYQAMQVLKGQTSSSEFLYMKHANPNAVRYNPYDLEIVLHSAITDKNFYTMSTQGVTQFVDGQAEFVTLDQWERDYLLYTQVVKLKLFSQFRLWKTFRTWRKRVAHKKSTAAKEELEKTLFMLDPIFSAAIMKIRGACEDLHSMRLHDLHQGSLYSLQDLQDMHAHQIETVKRQLSGFVAYTVATAQSSCTLSLEDQEQKLTAAKEAKFMASLGTITAVSSSKRVTNLRSQVATSSRMVSPAAAAYLREGADFSYAIQAAKRSAKRRIASFVRLLDFMIGNTLHTMLTTSVQDMLDMMTPVQPITPAPKFGNECDPQQSGQLQEVPDQVVEVAPATRPLLKVQIILDDQLDDLIFCPQKDQFYSCVEQMMTSFVQMVTSVDRLMNIPFFKDTLEHHTEPGLAEGLLDLILGEEHHDLETAVLVAVDVAFQAAESHKRDYLVYRDMVVRNREVSIPLMRREVNLGLRDLERFQHDLLHYQQQVQQILEIPKAVDLGRLRLELAQIAEAVIPSPKRCLENIHALLPELANEVYNRFIARVHEATSRLSILPTTVEEFVEFMQFLQVMEEQRQAFDEEADMVEAHYNLMEKFSVKVPELQYAAYRTMEDDLLALRDAMWQVDANKDKYLQQFCKELEEQVEELNKEVMDIRILAQNDLMIDERADQASAIAYAAELLNKVAAQKDAAARIANYQRLFKQPETQFKDLDDCVEEVELKHLLRKSLQEWEAQTNAWLGTHVFNIQPAFMDEIVSKFNKNAYRIERGLPANKMVPKLKESIAVWKEVVPVVACLLNVDLKERHWRKIEGILNAPISKADEVTLEMLLELNVVALKDDLVAVSTEASQEAVLELMLEKVQDNWKVIEFTVNSYKDSKDNYVLGSIDDVMQVLEESFMSMATITASRYASGIRADVERMEKQLRLFSDTLDEWLEVQRQWMYLESIFSTADIVRQLPAEARSFSQIDRQLRDIMRRTKDRPNALQAGTTPGWLQQFQHCNDELQRIQKNLEDYLETKRVAFPRFYFLSNEELLEILSQSKNPHAVQPHLQKCFDGIRLLAFGDESRSIDIVAMVSGEGERVSLGKNLKARGTVESWLTAVEASMKTSLRALAKRAHKEYLSALRGQWVLEQPAQLAIATSNIFWCQDVEECLAAPDPLVALQSLHVSNMHQLADLTSLVRGRLSQLERKVAVALITIDVHNRDIVEGLASANCINQYDFAWQMQLRYYWDVEQDCIIIQQVNARFEYGYEYLGAQPRLVVTPMTDRCYMTLTGALNLKLGGAPAGPAGTGKTETTKDLGKALGIQCVVFNCGENLDYKFMGKFFSGLAQCGAWACFDEFNRIDIEVLSVVAQQLLAIQNALKANVASFAFEGRVIKLVPSCGVFITMNPGYAGRTELPDNLKSLFRPMAMMIPDYALVAEVMLFSEGFNTAKTLSRKMVQLYKLCSEQLSQQDHYDFGMRALKSVLVMAGARKRAEPDLSEEIVLIRAMQDSNVPKFLTEDVILFNAIVSDLFPGIDVPDQDRGVLEVAVTNSCHTAGLQPVTEFVRKVLQLYETFDVRFGVMLVGPAGGGKTQCFRILQTATTTLRQAGNTKFQVVRTFVLNPKSVKMGELYGEYNAVTNEWTDGLASSIMRNAVADTSNDCKWIVFDGPVDAIWVENMNTVLDDNCTLCLPNGERIKLDPVRMRMLFEVQDLAVASPATVSRCGMVYVSAEDCGWRPYVRSWLDSLPTRLGTADNPVITLATGLDEFLWSFFDQHIDHALEFAKSQSSLVFLPSMPINNVESVTSLLEAMVHPRRGFDLGEELSEGQKVALLNIFVFCYIWGIGGNLAPGSWTAFDTFIRAEFETSMVFPTGGSSTVFDYCMAPERNYTLELWEKSVPRYHFDPQVPYFQILVPTVDTVRYGFLLEACLDVNRGVLLTGVSGVGKTAVINSTLQRLAGPSRLALATLNFSAQTSSAATQATIEAKLEKRRKARFGPPGGRRLALFVDDVNMPARETYGAQPPVELLRQMVDCQGFYHRKKLNWINIEDVLLLAACGPPGGGRQEITPRFTRHFTMLCLPTASEGAMRTMFASILSGYFDCYFPVDVGAKYTRPMVECSVDVYQRISKELLPTPTKSHYTFNLRDVSKVFQGITSIRPAQCSDARRTLPRLWVHENMRVFHDRLVCQEDRQYLTQMLFDMLISRFEVRASYEEVFGNNTIMFGDYMRMGAPHDERWYEEVVDQKKLLSTLEAYQEEYNLQHRSPTSLVFFQDTVQHISRTARTLRQPRGNAMLVGVGGSGKQTLTRFASFMANMPCISIELTRSYGVNEFREDMRKLYRIAGVDGKPITFLFTDSHIVHESFVEDINSILTSGDVAGMYKPDEREAILQDIRPWIQARGLEETRDAMWAAFIARVRDNLHVVLAMSPVGEAFRSRCRQFPALINCTTIDWFSPWPEDALQSVATRFLDAMQLGGPQINQAVVQMCVQIHVSVEQTAERFYQELRRRFYVTPKSYLDLISLYVQLLQQRQKEMQAARDRLLNGLGKLEEANEVVDRMQQELAELQPVLADKTRDTQELLLQVQKEQEDAQRIKAAVAAEEMEVGRKTVECRQLKDEAQRELEEVLPALEAAEKALNSLNKADIIEIKTFTKPPALVQLTMEGVCILLQEKPDWESAKKVLGDTNFIKRLVDFDKENLPERVAKSIKRIITDPAFTPDQVAKQSKAAMSMCLWVRAMDTYAQVSKVVEPKRQALGEAQTALDTMAAQLAAKQKQLQDIVQKVHGLEQQLQNTQDELKSLQQQAELSRKRLGNAGKLLSALGNESVRWKETTAQLADRLHLLVGDVFVSAACISYLGAFTGSYREELVAGWVAGCVAAGIPVSPRFTLVETLASPVEVRDWQLQGLPTDTLSTDNAILATRGSRWPLLIDPQRQALRWVRAMEEESGLRVVKASDGQLLRALEAAVRLGLPLLLQDVGEVLDPVLEPLLQKRIFTQGNRMLIRLGEIDVEYSAGFRFYITTQLPNPHYLPEVCIKVNLINFTVTMQGLEDQLLGEVVRLERPELEEQKDRLVLGLAADKRQLVELEDRILMLLRESQGNILDDELLINTLNTSKLTAGVIQGRVREAEQTELEINAAREKYRPVPVRAAVIFFNIADLPAIDPMYQYSLTYFIQLFKHCVRAAEPSPDLPTRLTNLLAFTTSYMYTTVCRGLFEEHKAIFSFLIATSILRQAGSVTPQEWAFFLRGSRMPDSMPPSPDPSWLPASAWQGVHGLEACAPAAFPALPHSIAEQPALWRQVVCCSEPYLMELQPLLGEECYTHVNDFHRLMLIKVLKEDATAASVRHFVRSSLGPEFSETQPFDMADIHADSAPSTPIIFILSQGADPTSALQRFAESNGRASGEGLVVISLGQGQGPVAEAAIKAAVESGQWVCLQNCHLAKSWMPRMEVLVEELQEKAEVHPDFRLWLTSMPAKHFPVSVLQCGLKISLEPPKGLRANLMRCYTDVPEGYLDAAGRPAAWQKLAFATCFFHAVVQERRRFGPLGWNIPYEFSAGDLSCSLQTLAMFLEQHTIPPWTALQYVIGQINYGGRVTDDNDRRLLMSVLQQCLSPSTLQDSFAFNCTGVYTAPAGGSQEEQLQHIRTLPAAASPEVFGLHPNAAIAFQMAETRRILDAVLAVQPRVSGAVSASGKSTDEVVLEAAAQLAACLPTPLLREEASVMRNPFAPLPSGHSNSLGTVLLQEMERFNALLAVVGRSVQELQRGLKGLVVMSGELEAMYTCLLNNQVPSLWARAAYPSLKPLASWMRDFCARMDTLQRWLVDGQPACFWLPGLFYPQGFMTAVLQNHARKMQTPIDRLQFSFRVLPLQPDQQPSMPPEDGVYVHGLFLESSTWDMTSSCLQEALPGEMFTAMPPLHLLPAKDYQPPSREYQCPLYKTAARAGVLSTTGQSTNFIVHISLPICSGTSPDFWIRQGVAALCSLSE